MPQERDIALAPKIIKFYMGCVEAEAAMQVRVKPGAPGHIELKSGTSPVHGRCGLPDRKDVHQLCEKFREGANETLLAGWPLVLGHDSDSGSAGTVASPLLLADVMIGKGTDGWSSFPEFGVVDLNPFALDLIVGDRDERESIMRSVWLTPSVEEALSPAERADRILEVLAGAGIAGLDHLDSRSLTDIGQEFGVYNAGMILPAGVSSHMTRMLMDDLKDMLDAPHQLAKGPIAVMLGLEPYSTKRHLASHPTVLPSTLAQDRAVASAMRNPFTVVTGPPGTGKSQVLVNTISAAVARGERVLFASKNNQAVDVVFERLTLTSDGPCIVRAGSANMRGEVSSRISKILAAPRKDLDLSAARDKWDEFRSEIEGIHVSAAERDKLERGLLSAEQDLQRFIEKQWSVEDSVEPPVDDEAEHEPIACTEPPHSQDAPIDAAPLLEAIEQASSLLADIADVSCRRRISRSLREESERAIVLLVNARSNVDEWLAAEQQRQTGTAAAISSEAGAESPPPVSSDEVRQHLGVIRAQISKCRDTIRGIKERIVALPPKQSLDDRLHSHADTRNEVGRGLLDARWEQIRRGNLGAIKAAGELAQHLSMPRDEIRQKRIHAQVREALPALPVWGVTNLSARTNLPLDKGMFDLVIIDEASQCDAASALPLLMRAKRAMIIGDIRQLNHITNLSGGREDIMGQKARLAEDEIAEFSYRSRSCFSLAASRLAEDPIFLDLHFRSHPAIIGFPNQEFYDERLEFCSASRPPLGAKAITWESVDGKCSRGPNNKSFRNRDEAREVVDRVVAAFPEYEGLGISVGVVTPFKAQNELIRELLSKALGADLAQKITVGTVHRYQGDERDVIFFSPVIAPPYVDQTIWFASDQNLVNVAMTRAKRRFVVVGNREACVEQPSVLADLSAYISRLDAGAYDSPVEEMLANALRERNVYPQTGQSVAGHRLDLAVVRGDRRLDIECDGAAFHTDLDHDEMRDMAISNEGWEVLRFSGRRVCNDSEHCVDEIIAALENEHLGNSDGLPTEEPDDPPSWPWESPNA